MTDTSPPTLTLPRKARFAMLATYLLFGTLLALFLYWNLSRASGFKPAVLLVQTLPLLALLPGMLLQRYRSYSWLCFVLLFYFLFAVERVFSSLREPSDSIFLTLVVLLFLTAMMASRWLQRAQKQLEE